MNFVVILPVSLYFIFACLRKHLWLIDIESKWLQVYGSFASAINSWQCATGPAARQCMLGLCRESRAVESSLLEYYSSSF